MMKLRRFGLALVVLASLGLTVLSSTQIISAVFRAADAPTDLSCHDGVAALQTAVFRARDLAGDGTRQEREAVTTFRASLQPEWNSLDSIATACSGDEPALAALRAVTLLRYAEEQAVRYEALDLSYLRKRAPELTNALSPPSKSSSQ